MNVATAIATAAKPDAELATHVVRTALERAGLDFARGVLLFLTTDFAHNAHAAVVAAQRAANCLQVTGCTAPGILTEEDWVLDRPGACAMVFGEGYDLGLTHGSSADSQPPILTLSTPSATAGWLEGGPPRYGMLSTDNSARGDGRLWSHGKMSTDGRCVSALPGARVVIGVSRGVHALGPAQAVEAVDGLDLQKLGKHLAYDALLRALPVELRDSDNLPFHLLAAALVLGDPQGALEEGRYTMVPLIAANHDERSITLAAQVAIGDFIFWTLRKADAAERDMQAVAEHLAQELQEEPDFGLMFSCLGRGPYFFGGEDRDLAAVKARFPGLALIGGYGSGQIAPLFNSNRVLNNTVLLALFRSRSHV